MRIAIVNDSVLALEGLRRVISMVPEYQLIWMAHDGAEAVERCAEDLPDLILMDLIMPVMDGVEASRKIMQATPCAILVVTATVKGNAALVFEAMGAGALDAVNTPVLGADGNAEGKDALLRKIKLVGTLISQHSESTVAAVDSNLPAASDSSCLIAIGASTGGPAALADLLAKLPADFPAAILISQHVHEQFVESFAVWLDGQTDLKVRLAAEGDKVETGTVLISPSNHHMIMQDGSHVRLSEQVSDAPYHPSINALFDSVAYNWRGCGYGVLMTGMGWDGAAGLLSMRREGFHTIAQDQASCAVYGMPKKAVELGAADEVVALDALASRLIALVTGRQSGCKIPQAL